MKLGTFFGADSVDDLNEKVEEASGVLARHQRLIYKGKVLAKGTSLAELKLKHGSKVMLMASSSTATQVRSHLAIFQMINCKETPYIK